MLKIYENIKKLRIKLGMTQSDLANKLGYADKSMIAKIEAGKVDLSQSKVVDFAKILHVTPSYLMGWEEESKTTINAQPSKGVKIPVLGSVAAGVPIEAIEDVIDYEEISKQLASTGNFFALQIKGDSMSPRICDKDVVIVKQQNEVENGDIAIVLVNGDDATCKKVIKKDTGIMLMPLNNEFEPMFFGWSEIQELPVAIIGKVVELRGKF